MSEKTCECKNGNCNCEGGCECGCSCCADEHHFQRLYLTKTEQIEELEAYLAELKLEVQAVEERLEDLRE